MQIFDEVKNQGVEDIFFLAMDGVSGLESGARETEINVERLPWSGRGKGKELRTRRTAV